MSNTPKSPLAIAIEQAKPETLLHDAHAALSWALDMLDLNDALILDQLGEARNNLDLEGMQKARWVLDRLRETLQEYQVAEQTAESVGTREDDRIHLTVDQALSMLDPDADPIHTFRHGQPAGPLFGAEWDRIDVEQAICEHRCELGGLQCQSLNHGLVIFDRTSPVFVECREGFDYAAFEQQVRKSLTGHV